MSKRDRDGFAVPDEPPKKKKRLNSPTYDELPDIDPSLLDDPSILDDELNALIDQAEDISDFDSSSLKKVCLQFEKAITKNQDLRIKYSNDPSKFMESEMELDTTLQELRILAVSPSLYKEFISIGSMKSLIGLLSHENTDLANDVVSLLLELFSPFTIEENKEAKCIIDAFLDLYGIDFLIEHMKRLDENIDDESTGFFNSINIIENLTEILGNCDALVQKDNLMKFLLLKSKESPVLQNRSYSSEVLSIILTNSDKAKELLGDSSGLEQILTILANYRKKDPETNYEEEIIENLFVCTGSCLLHYPNHKKFDSLEGIQLMIIFIKKGMFCKHGAITIIDNQLNNDPEMCSKFIKYFGLGSLFSSFMRTKKKKKQKKYGQSENEQEEHIVAIISSLILHTSGTELQRVLHKFKENEYEKIERLIDLYEKNYKRSIICENKIEELKKERTDIYEDYDPSIDEVEFELLRLREGLYILQMICIIINFLYILCDDKTKQKITNQLSINGRSLLHVYQILGEYVNEIDKNTLHADRVIKAAAELYLIVKNEFKLDENNNSEQ